MSYYTFALSSPVHTCSLRSAPTSTTTSRSNSVSSTSSTSSIYSRLSPTNPVSPIARRPSPPETKPKKSFFHHHTMPPAPPPSIVDTKKQAREARDARNRALRLREQLLRDGEGDEESSSPGRERRAKREGSDHWKVHYENVMMEEARRLKR